jgi:formylglycine-generating enzyme required for sulfatase activity
MCPNDLAGAGPSTYSVIKTVLLVVIVNVLFILGINTLFYILINCLYHKEGNTMKRRFLLLTYLLMSITILNADVKVKDVVVKPRWPWNGLVDITYSIECDEKDGIGNPMDVWLDFTAIDNDRTDKDGAPRTLVMEALTGDGAIAPVKHGGPYTVTWNMAKDEPDYNSSSFQVRIHAIIGGKYLKIYDMDKDNWKFRYTNIPPDLSKDDCRTTELWFRRVEAGTLSMEVDLFSPPITVTILPFYIGVFECTQKQWKLVMKDNRNAYFKYLGECHPMETVSYNIIRGETTDTWAGWPECGYEVSKSSFMGKLREKLGNKLTFDLPTEAQWEFAARGGNESKGYKYSGSNNEDEVAWHYWNSQRSTHVVGTKKPNELGIYDMSGNVSEWCIDWTDWDNSYGSSHEIRRKRGGSWDFDESRCTVTVKELAFPTFSYNETGFRIVCIPKQYLYAVIDLSGGTTATSYPVRYTDKAPNLNDDTCRTTELWLRRIPAGTFTMGSPSNESGRNNTRDMAQHQVTISQTFYLGIFEITQKQYQLVMGTNPSYYKGDTRPVELVSYNMLRGTVNGAKWPGGNQVEEGSFFHVLRAKTSLHFDLPTEAQWEYACRAGTSTALNSGKNLTGTTSCSNLAKVGRYKDNQNDEKGGYSQHTKVGSYLPNAWGLYDMHGNVWEWCRDWWGANIASTEAETDPVGPLSGSDRVERGGDWYNDARFSRSASRYECSPSDSDRQWGFRVACFPLIR